VMSKGSKRRPIDPSVTDTETVGTKWSATFRKEYKPEADYPDLERCPFCDGSGVEDPDTIRSSPCRRCRGSGTLDD